MTQQANITTHPRNDPGRSAAKQWLAASWPIAAGLAAAALQLATGAGRDAVTITLVVATLCYLGAAALNRTWVAWVGIPGGGAVVVIAKLLGQPWWAGIAIAAIVLLIIGLLLRVPRRPLTAQTIALVGFGCIAVIALFLEPRAGLVIAGLLLASHAVWDAIHYRRNVVVSRSLAMFCMFLDVPLGIGAIVLAFLP